ncbi:hypothetical protein [Devosia rhizoryzae]|uniref:Yip1 domain-containing protein n=1 Tax=Devosia rhizoryzae TaxID=2774137 RepID=A0ABX7C5R1_9HYPH|nr:hypothetical protein [Devosia rhizoryzae]QQR38559.1 hypothetical protein JI748_12360 [Devosia rhizoryzae]
MTLWLTLRDALTGWLKLLRDEPGWEAHFRLSRAGLVTALALFYLFAFLAVMLASLQVGVPTLPGFINIMLVQSLWLVALLIGIFVTRNFLRARMTVLPLLIPAIFALIAYLVLGTLVSLILGALLPLLWLGLAVLLFRLGRAAGQWTRGVSVAFAVLTTVLLVGLPMTLYMLSAAAIPAA